MSVELLHLAHHHLAESVLQIAHVICDPEVRDFPLLD